MLANPPSAELLHHGRLPVVHPLSRHAVKAPRSGPANRSGDRLASPPRNRPRTADRPATNGTNDASRSASEVPLTSPGRRFAPPSQSARAQRPDEARRQPRTLRGPTKPLEVRWPLYFVKRAAASSQKLPLQIVDTGLENRHSRENTLYGALESIHLFLGCILDVHRYAPSSALPSR